MTLAKRAVVDDDADWRARSELGVHGVVGFVLLAALTLQALFGALVANEWQRDVRASLRASHACTGATLTVATYVVAVLGAFALVGGCSACIEVLTPLAALGAGAGYLAVAGAGRTYEALAERHHAFLGETLVVGVAGVALVLRAFGTDDVLTAVHGVVFVVAALVASVVLGRTRATRSAVPHALVAGCVPVLAALVLVGSELARPQARAGASAYHTQMSGSLVALLLVYVVARLRRRWDVAGYAIAVAGLLLTVSRAPFDARVAELGAPLVMLVCVVSGFATVASTRAYTYVRRARRPRARARDVDATALGDIVVDEEDVL